MFSKKNNWIVGEEGGGVEDRAYLEGRYKSGGPGRNVYKNQPRLSIFICSALRGADHKDRSRCNVGDEKCNQGAPEGGTPYREK